MRDERPSAVNKLKPKNRSSAMEPNIIHIYQAEDGWRWRMKPCNGRIVADSGQAYKSRRHARRAVDSIVAREIVVAD